MDESIHGYALTAYASAEFDNMGAGAGENTEAFAFGTLGTTITNVTQRHMQHVSQATDERYWIRNHRKKLKETIQINQDRYLDFLVPNTLSSESEKKVRSALSRFGRDDIPSNIKALISLRLDLSMNEVVEELEVDISCNLLKMKDTFDRIFEIHSTTLTELFTLDGQIQQKLQALQKLSARLDSLLFMDSIPELQDLTESMSKYIDALFEKNEVGADYEKFMRIYKKWWMLHNLISYTSHRSDTSGITCSICTVNEVSAALTPCGHTFCGGCAAKQLTSCYICRSGIRDRLKIYLS